MTTEKPENIGDVYEIIGYVGDLTYYGAAYRGPSSFDPDRRWAWWLEVSDGDCYQWDDEAGTFDILADSVRLYRRNPLPGRISA